MLLPEMIYPMVNGEMEEKNNLADKGVLIEISKQGKNWEDFFLRWKLFFI